MKDKELKKNLEKLRQLLSNSGGNINDETIDLLKNITNKTKNNQTNLISTNINNSLDSKQIVEQVSQIKNSDVVERAIEKSLKSLIEPVKIIFSREVSRYVDSISADKKVTKKIPRTIQKKSIKKIVDGQFVSAFPNDDGKVINPEFKQLLATGYRPSDIADYERVKPGTPGRDIGDPSSEFIKNFRGTGEPGDKIENIEYTIPKYGSVFKDSFEISSDKITYSETPQYKSLSIRGEIKNSFDISQIASTRAIQPQQNWNINYKEQGDKYILTINNNFNYSKNSQLVPNVSKYRFVGNTQDSLQNATRVRLNSISPTECNVYSNEELFGNILKRKLDGKIINLNNLTSQQTEQFNNFLKQKHPLFIKDFIKDLFSVLTNNRLLKTFSINNTQNDEQVSPEEQNNLILLNLVNFIPEPTEELKGCGKTIHPLNVDEITRLMKEKFNSIGLQTFPKQNCEERQEVNPITEASIFGCSLMLIRLISFEYILKNLFIFDELGYGDITKGPVIKQHLYLIIKKELQELGIYEEVEEVLLDSYELLKQNNIITEEDEQVSSEVFVSSIDNKTFELPPENIKNIINSFYRKTTNYIKNLLGSTTETQRDELDILVGRTIYDLCDINKVGTELSNRISNRNIKKNELSRFTNNHKNLNQFFILEKLISLKPNRIGSNSNTGDMIDDRFYNSLPNKSRIANKVLANKNINQLSFKDFSLYMENIRNNLEIPQIQRLFSGGTINISLKNSLVFKQRTLFQSNDTLDSLTDDEMAISTKCNKFYLSDTGEDNAVDIRFKFIDSEKGYVFFDYNNDSKQMSLYNSLPIDLQEIEIKFNDIFANGTTTAEQIQNRLNELFIREKKRLINNLSRRPDYEILIKKCMMADKIMNISSLYSFSALSTEQVDTLFIKSKRKIKSIMMAGKNINNYSYQNEDEIAGGSAALYQTDFQNIGNPNGSGGFDILQFLITTPILILKGLTQIMDPNIAIASQIVNAAAAGLLLPKLNEQGQPIGYPGDPLILPTALASMALLPVNLLPPGFGIGPPVTPIPGMLYWALEPLLWKLPYFQNQAAKSSQAKSLKNKPGLRGFNPGAENFRCDKDQDDI
jgi:hypothetical protein